LRNLTAWILELFHIWEHRQKREIRSYDNANCLFHRLRTSSSGTIDECIYVIYESGKFRFIRDTDHVDPELSQFLTGQFNRRQV
jgi:hypothetical protein